MLVDMLAKHKKKLSIIADSPIRLVSNTNARLTYKQGVKRSLVTLTQPPAPSPPLDQDDLFGTAPASEAVRSLVRVV